MDVVSEALVASGLITAERIQELRSETGGRGLIARLLDTQAVSDEDLANLYARRFRVSRGDPSNIEPEALAGFSERLAMKYVCIPFHRLGNRLSVAMVDPLDFEAIQDISFATGCTAIPHVAPRNEILAAINACFHMSTELTTVLNSAEAEAGDLELVSPGDEGDVTITSAFETGGRMELGDDSLSAPAIKMVNLFLKEAFRQRASDVHIEPGQKTVEVRFRIDGVLRTYSQFPKWMHAAVVSRIKIMAKLDISNRRTPQDGGLKVKIGDRSLDLRVSTLPTHLGEKAVVRLLNPDDTRMTLEDTGMDDKDLQTFRRLVTAPQGIMLVTGPTGSGKTTTLHGALTEINTGANNIITVEDPVEYELEGITQVQVNERAGLTFANTLRSILRQDPDVVMVGEIRDLETAEIALKAAMTGHLVLSTLHTNDTASTITRLVEMGVEPYLLASSVLGVMAQRLVRVNCEHCVAEYTPDPALLDRFPGIRRDARFFRGQGCERCGETGFRGRMAVTEVMPLSPAVRNLIANKATDAELKTKAQSEGMRTLYDSAMEKVYRGATTLEEVLRVVSVDAPEGRECTVCGQDHTGDACSSCGDDAELACPRCGYGLEVDWAFCPRCAARSPVPALPASTTKPRVLVVDDEEGIRKMVSLALRQLDVEIHTAGNGKQALGLAETLQPHLVITDVNMPIMNGFELVEALRKKIATMFIPIIILSSRDSAEDKLTGFTFGTDDYITKPFDYAELQARVRRLLERSYGQ